MPQKRRKIILLSFERRDHRNCCRDNKQTLLIMTCLYFSVSFISRDRYQHKRKHIVVTCSAYKNFFLYHFLMTSYLFLSVFEIYIKENTEDDSQVITTTTNTYKYYNNKKIQIQIFAEQEFSVFFALEEMITKKVEEKNHRQCLNLYFFFLLHKLFGIYLFCVLYQDNIK